MMRIRNKNDGGEYIVSDDLVVSGGPDPKARKALQILVNNLRSQQRNEIPLCCPMRYVAHRLSAPWIEVLEVKFPEEPPGLIY